MNLGTMDRAGAGRGMLFLGVLLSAATVLVYAQVWQFEFITVDDGAYVTQNPRVQGGLTLRNLTWSFTSVHDSNWIPLTWLSLMLDTEIYGVRPGGYHLTNVFLHAANTVLLFAALSSATRNRTRSAFVAALFALHPLHVESVAWIAERKDVLSTMFGLLSLLTYVRYATGGRSWSLSMSLLFFICSLLSKQTLVTLPFVFLLLDFWPLGRMRVSGELSPPPARLRRIRGDEARLRDGKDRAGTIGRSTVARLVVKKIPFFVVSVVFSVIVMTAQSRGGAVKAFSGFSLSTRCMNAILVYATYLWKTLNPQNLAIYYPHPGNKISLVAVGIAALLLLAISAAAIVWFRRYPFFFVGWCWYLGTLVPMIGLVQIGSQQMADRYTYFPLIGAFIAVAWLVPELAPAGILRVRLLPAAAIACVALLAVTTFSQISYWHDSVTLLRHSLDCTPDNSVAHEFLGGALLAQGDVSGGVAELQTATRMAPWYAPLHFSLAAGLQRLGRLDDAAEQYRAALAIDDRMADAHVNLGAILSAREQYPQAKQHFRRALEIDESSIAAHISLASLCLKTHDYGEAIAHAERALELNPDLLICHHYVALGLRGQGRIDEAIRRLQRLVEISPDDQIARQELARTMELKQGASGN